MLAFAPKSSICPTKMNQALGECKDYFNIRWEDFPILQTLRSIGLRVGRSLYSSTKVPRAASVVTVWSGIRTVLSPKNPTLTSAYSGPRLSFNNSLINLPIFRPRGSQTQQPAHCSGLSNRSAGYAPPELSS